MSSRKRRWETPELEALMPSRFSGLEEEDRRAKTVAKAFTVLERL